METIADHQVAPKLSRDEIKSLVVERCRAIAKGVPAAWSAWDYEQTHAFKRALGEINPGNTLPKLIAAVKIVAPAYGRAVEEIVPAEALK